MRREPVKKKKKTPARRPALRECLRYPQVKGKGVDSVELWADPDNHAMTVWFEDRTCLHFDLEPGLTVRTELLRLEDRRATSDQTLAACLLRDFRPGADSQEVQKAAEQSLRCAARGPAARGKNHFACAPAVETAGYYQSPLRGLASWRTSTAACASRDGGFHQNHKMWG